MGIFILLIVIVVLFIAAIGVILMKKDNSNAVGKEKMTDDVSVLMDEKNNVMDEEII